MVSHAGSITAQELVEAAPDALIVSNEAGDIVLLNQPAERLFGYPRGELLGQKIEVLMPARFRAVRLDHQADSLHHTRRRPMGMGQELYGIRKDSTEFPIEINLSPLKTARGTFVVSAIRDITERKRAEAARAEAIRARAQTAESELIRERARLVETSRAARAARALSQRMSHLAQHDALTALPNRLLLRDRLGRAITLARRYRRRVALLFVDLDHFKQVNDSMGHAMGDQLLRSVAERLQACVRQSDTVSRYGGDEFLILLPELDDPVSAGVSARKIIAAATMPHHIAQHNLRITVSVGISVYPDDCDDVESLIDHADAAMYLAKEHGRNAYRFFAQDTDVQPDHRQSGTQRSA